MDGHSRIRRGGRLFFVLAGLFAGTGATASPIVVTNANDSGAGSLRDAITQANASGSASTIQFDASLAGQTIALGSTLPIIADDLSIDGGDGVTLTGQGQHRIFFVEQGNVSMSNLTLADGYGKGGDGGHGDDSGAGGGGLGAGGALFVNEDAHVTLTRVTLTDNQAVGGDGGNATGGATQNGGGGGGGFGGDGGNGADRGGGGGGGYGAAGGDGGTTSGGGGGGTNITGSSGSGATGGAGGGEGGDGGDNNQPGQNGSTYGGGGGGGESATGGDGGDYAGGGGGGYNRSAGNGGFGGGGGGRGVNAGGSPSPGTGGFGAGDGSNFQQGADGGSGYGGAIFVREGGSLTIIDTTITDSAVTAGQGGSGAAGHTGSAGDADGAGLYLMQDINAQIGVNDGSTLLYSASIAGPGGLTKIGDGTLMFVTSHTYTGDTHVNAGRLHLTGSLAGDAFVASDALLSGTGTVAGDLTNAGSLQPGNSIGTFTVQGDYTHQAAAVLQVEIDAAGNTPGVHSDLVDVTGTATLHGGEVQVVAAPGHYADGTQYTFLEADGGVTGTFDDITDVNLGYRWTTDLSYTANTALFTITLKQSNYESLGRNDGQRAIGRQLDTLFPHATGDFELIFENLELLGDDDQRTAIQQLSGETLGAGAAATLQTMSRAQEMVFNRLRPGAHTSGSPGDLSFSSPNPRLSLASADAQPYLLDTTDARREPDRWVPWVQGFGEHGDVRSSPGSTGFDYWTGGVLLGIDRPLDNNWLVGARGGYARSRVDSAHGRQELDVDHYQLGVHARYNQPLWYGLGSVFTGYQRYDSERRLRFAGFDRQAEAKANGGHVGAAVELGRKLGNRTVAFQPVVGLQYIYLRRASFNESGAGAANLRVSAENTQSLRSSLGFNLAHMLYEQNDTRLQLNWRGRWMYEFLDEAGEVTARFAEPGMSTFNVESASLDHHRALLGTGLAWQIDDRTHVGVHYDASFNSHFVSHQGSVALSYVW